MTHHEHAHGLYEAATRVVKLMVNSELKLTDEEWQCLYELHRAVNEYERLNSLRYT